MGPREPRSLALVPRLSVDQLLWVANTRHGPAAHWFARPDAGAADHDHLDDRADAAEYLRRHGMPVPDEPPSEADLRRLAAIRAMVHGLADARAGDAATGTAETSRPIGGGWTPEAAAILAAARYALAIGPDTPGIRADAKGWDALVGDLMLPLIDLARSAERLRRCRNPGCRLLFLDVSRNGSRQWCDTGGCGNRDRVRRYRRSAATAD